MSERASLVPLSHSLEVGTAGHTANAAGNHWDNSGTPSLKSLALKVLQRDKGRDTSGTKRPISCPTVDKAVGQDHPPSLPEASSLNSFVSLSERSGRHDLDERAALIEYGAGVPRRWAEGYLALCSMPAPAGFSPERWHRIIDATGAFLDQWAAKAIDCGWSDLDVFGCNPDRPDARFDAMGLTLLLDRARIVSLDSTGADLVVEPGAACQRYRRRSLPANTVSLWVLDRDD